MLLAGRFEQKFISVGLLPAVDLIIVLVLTAFELRSRRKIQICHQGLPLESNFKFAICCLVRCLKFGWKFSIFQICFWNLVVQRFAGLRVSNVGLIEMSILVL